MAEVEAPTKADAIALLARRLRQRYGRQLQKLFVLKDDPYEPAGEDFAIHLVAVFEDESYDHDQAIKEAVRLGNSVDADMGYAFASTIYPISTSDFDEGRRWPARTARRKGVAL